MFNIVKMKMADSKLSYFVPVQRIKKIYDSGAINVSNVELLDETMIYRIEGTPEEIIKEVIAELQRSTKINDFYGIELKEGDTVTVYKKGMVEKSHDALIAYDRSSASFVLMPIDQDYDIFKPLPSIASKDLYLIKKIGH